MNWQVLIDPVGAALVLGGTLAAVLLRCGAADCGTALVQLAASLRSGFDRSAARAKLARQVEAIQRDGLLCAADTSSGDEELDAARANLLRHRSIPVLLAEHRRHRRLRLVKGERAVGVLDSAGDLAPVFGLAGTLFALSQMATGTSAAPPAMMTGVALAVVTTLYGVLAAHLVFYPLARRVERRMMREDAAREELVTWLAAQSAAAIGEKPGYLPGLLEDAA